MEPCLNHHSKVSRDVAGQSLIMSNMSNHSKFSHTLIQIYKTSGLNRYANCQGHLAIFPALMMNEDLQAYTWIEPPAFCKSPRQLPNTIIFSTMDAPPHSYLLS